MKEKNLCPNCKANLAYDERFDADYCPICKIWLENVCTDPDCFYCSKRPEKPIPKNKIPKIG